MKLHTQISNNINHNNMMNNCAFVKEVRKC